MTHGVVGAADSIPGLLSEITGAQFDDLEIIAQTSVEIAARIGATATMLSVRANTIPATGAVPLTSLDPKIVNHTGPAIVLDGHPIQLTITGELNGVPGYLRRRIRDGRTNDQVPIGSFSFTRLTKGVRLACPSDSRFVPDATER